MYILNENKDRFIDKNPNLTPEQKQQVKDLFKKYPYLESKAGDWQKSSTWTWEDFRKLFDMASQSKTHIKKKAGIEGLTEGEDYELIYDDGSVVAYKILNHLASSVIASNRVKPEVWSPIPGWYSDNPEQDYTPKDPDKTSRADLWSGAKWCISMKHTTRYWDNYTSGEDGKGFVFVLSEDETKVPTKKLAFTLYGIKDEHRRLDLEIFNVPDSNRDELAREAKKIPKDSKYPELARIYQAAIRSFFKTGEAYLQELIAAKIVVPSYKEGYYDVIRPDKVSPDRLRNDDGTCFCKFNIWKGNYKTYGRDMATCPRVIQGNFTLMNAESMENCPEKVTGNFEVCPFEGALENLKGMTPDIRGDIKFREIGIKSLEGAPKTIRRNISLISCRLASLEGLGVVGGRLDIDGNFLRDLKGPTKVGSLSARMNELSTLEGMPEVDGMCDVSNNPNLTSLDGLNLTRRGFILHKKTGI